jgi:hypothetical protein
MYFNSVNVMGIHWQYVKNSQKIQGEITVKTCKAVKGREQLSPMAHP